MTHTLTIVEPNWPTLQKLHDVHAHMYVHVHDVIGDVERKKKERKKERKTPEAMYMYMYIHVCSYMNMYVYIKHLYIIIINHEFQNVLKHYLVTHPWVRVPRFFSNCGQ